MNMKKLTVGQASAILTSPEFKRYVLDTLDELGVFNLLSAITQNHDPDHTVLPPLILAGGAISNMAHNFLHGTKYPIKDLDFYTVGPSPTGAGQLLYNTIPEHRGINTILSSGKEYHYFLRTASYPYRIDIPFYVQLLSTPYVMPYDKLLLSQERVRIRDFIPNDTFKVPISIIDMGEHHKYTVPTVDGWMNGTLNNDGWSNFIINGFDLNCTQMFIALPDVVVRSSEQGGITCGRNLFRTSVSFTRYFIDWVRGEQPAFSIINGGDLINSFTRILNKTVQGINVDIKNELLKLAFVFKVIYGYDTIKKKSKAVFNSQTLSTVLNWNEIDSQVKERFAKFFHFSIPGMSPARSEMLKRHALNGVMDEVTMTLTIRPTIHETDFPTEFYTAYRAVKALARYVTALFPSRASKFESAMRKITADMFMTTLVVFPRTTLLKLTPDNYLQQLADNFNIDIGGFFYLQPLLYRGKTYPVAVFTKQDDNQVKVDTFYQINISDAERSIDRYTAIIKKPCENCNLAELHNVTLIINRLTTIPWAYGTAYNVIMGFVKMYKSTKLRNLFYKALKLIPGILDNMVMIAAHWSNYSILRSSNSVEDIIATFMHPLHIHRLLALTGSSPFKPTIDTDETTNIEVRSNYIKNLLSIVNIALQSSGYNLNFMTYRGLRTVPISTPGFRQIRVFLDLVKQIVTTRDRYKPIIKDVGVGTPIPIVQPLAIELTQKVPNNKSIAYGFWIHRRTKLILGLAFTPEPSCTILLDNNRHNSCVTPEIEKDLDELIRKIWLINYGVQIYSPDIIKEIKRELEIPAEQRSSYQPAFFELTPLFDDNQMPF